MYQWTGNVGLVNVSDLLRASTNIACTSATDQIIAARQKIPQETCGSYLITFDLGFDEIGYWTMNALSTESDSSSTDALAVGFLQGAGIFNGANSFVVSIFGARPVVFLKSSIQITGGDGTKSNPYIIA